MPDLIRAYDNQNEPIVDGETGLLSLLYFNLVSLCQGERYSQRLQDFESVCVLLSGTCTIGVDETSFAEVGKREDIWSGLADSVYAPPDSKVSIVCTSARCEIAIAGGRCNNAYRPFRISPEDVDMVDVGSAETNSRRRIFHILGKNAEGRAGNLLVSELYADPGCWSGYPPHKHDEEDGELESEFEELYHYRFSPESGFGGQFAFQPDGFSMAFMTKQGDSFLLDKGYHPTVTSPGHKEYIFTILVGRNRRSLIQKFSQDHRYLLDQIPGLQDMVAKFK